jgi:uncharacterized protein
VGAVHRIAPGDRRRMPWRNGGGTTAEIVAEPGPGGRFRFRLSIADVTASGPFSDFTGYDRHILLLEGKGFTLRVAGDAPRVVDRPLVPHAFDGGRAVSCALHGGPVRDLNLMVDRATTRGSIEVLRMAAGERVELPSAATVLAYLVSGAAGACGVRLAPGDALRADGWIADRLRVEAGEGSALVVAAIDPVRPTSERSAADLASRR